MVSLCNKKNYAEYNIATNDMPLIISKHISNNLNPKLFTLDKKRRKSTTFKAQDIYLYMYRT